jgi:hypothetical protein
MLDMRLSKRFLCHSVGDLPLLSRGALHYGRLNSVVCFWDKTLPRTHKNAQEP